MVKVSVVLSASVLVFWISVLGSSGQSLLSWGSTSGKALTPRVLGLLLWSPVVIYQHRRRRDKAKLDTGVSFSRLGGINGNSVLATPPLLSMTTTMIPYHHHHHHPYPPTSQQKQQQDSSRTKLPSNPSSLHDQNKSHNTPTPPPMSNLLLHGRNSNSHQAVVQQNSEATAETVVSSKTSAPVNQQEPNGITLMVAISTVLLFATFVAF